MKFYSQYEPPPDVGLCCEDESLTSQEFVTACDINVLMARYVKTGMFPEGVGGALFGDAASVGDFQAAQEKVILAQEAFASLPAAVRERFANNPVELLAFVADVGNREEAIRLGLVKPVDVPGGDSAVPAPAPAPVPGGSKA